MGGLCPGSRKCKSHLTSHSHPVVSAHGQGQVDTLGCRQTSQAMQAKTHRLLSHRQQDMGVSYDRMVSQTKLFLRKGSQW